MVSTNSKKQKQKQKLLLKNRKPLTEFTGAERKEKFNGPGSYDLKDDPQRVKTFSISPAPRFSYEAELNEKKKKSIEFYEQELKKKFGTKKIPEAHAADGQTADVLFKGVEKPARSVDFGQSHAPRFQWQMDEMLTELRKKRDEKLAASPVADPFLKKRKSAPEPQDLDVDRAYSFVKERPLAPVMRPETDKELKEKKAKEIALAKKKPLSQEELERIAAVENHGTISGEIRASRKGDFGRGAERELALGVKLNAPNATYNVDLDVIKPKVPVPVIQPPSSSKHESDALQQRIAQTEKQIKLAALAKKYEEATLQASERALSQLDKTSTHSRSPGVIFTTTPISAEMPLAYNEGNFWNSRSMRAALCDTDGMRIQCAALKGKNNTSSSSSSSVKKKQHHQRPSSAGVMSTPNNNNNNNSAQKRLNMSHESHQQQEHSQLFQEAFASPFSRSTPQPKTKISITSPIFGGGINDDNDVFKLTQHQHRHQLSPAAGNISHHLMRAAKFSSSTPTPSHNQQQLTTVQNDDERKEGNIDENILQDNSATTNTTNTTITQHATVNDASIFSDGTSPALVGYQKAIPLSKIKSERAKPDSAMGWRSGGGKDLLAKFDLTNSGERGNHLRGGIPLSSLLRKEKLKSTSVFTSIYDDLGGASKRHLDEVERELYSP